jgi:IS5 family transposase
MKLLQESQMTFIKYDLELLVKKDHILRKVQNLIAFDAIANKFKDLEKETGRPGHGVEVGIRSIFLQFFFDLSDREMEDGLTDNIAYRWFCGYSLEESTPDHTFFCRIRKTLGTKRIGKIFELINKQAEKNGILRRVFTFVDASSIKTKETTWVERDKAIAQGEEALNNENVGRYSADSDARFGCKGKNKFWYGFKRHISRDMGSGLIKKTAVTKANVPDQKGLELICPDEGMIFGDKSYCLKEAQTAMQQNGCHSGAILKNNMKKKNKDKDRWISGLRSPYESVFSKLSKWARYRGLVKVQMQSFLEAIVFNVKTLITLNSPPLIVGA